MLEEYKTNDTTNLGYANYVRRIDIKSIGYIHDLCAGDESRINDICQVILFRKNI